MSSNFSEISDELSVAARDELERVLADKEFKCPPRRRRLFRFIVEETLAGRRSKLNAVPIAQIVFGRGDKFDHQSDPVVRIEAYRLRNDLAYYYAQSGRKHPVHISIPKGSYVAQFSGLQKPAHLEIEESLQTEKRFVPTTSRLTMQSIGIFGALIIAVVAAYFWSQAKPFASGPRYGPIVAVEPFDSNGTLAIEMAEGIRHEIVDALFRFSNLKVVASDVAPNHSKSNATTQVSVTAASYKLDGKIVTTSSDFRLVARLTRNEDDAVVWSDSYSGTLTARDLMATEIEIANDIASKLGQRYGPLNKDLQSKIADLDPSLNGYRCMLMAYHYRRNAPGEELYKPVETCLKETVVSDPEYADAWAMLALLRNDAIRFKRVNESKFEETRRNAISEASKALALDPANVLGNIAMSAIRFYTGDFQESERYARLALESNPHDPYILALLSFRLIMRGNFEEGTPLIENSIERSVNPAGWFYAVLAIDRLMQRDGESMLAAAEKATISGSALSQSLVVMAYGLLGDRAGASEAIQRMNDISPSFNPIERFKQHQATDEILDAMSKALNSAGWLSEESAS